MSEYRVTTRVGPCIHCGRATVQTCVACERFVCDGCRAVHDAAPGR